MNTYLSVDVGGSKILGCLFDENRKVLEKHLIETCAHLGREEVKVRLITLIEKLLKENTLGISVILPCVIKDDICVECSNVPINGFDVRKHLEERFKRPVFIGNDVNLALYGEVKEREVKHAVGIYVGTGVGGGLFFNGELYTGLGAAGEVGHMTVAYEGLPCGCNGQGCLEAYASKRAMLKEIVRAKERKEESLLFQFITNDEEMFKLEDLYNVYKKGDALAKALIDRSTHYLALTVSNLHTLLHPEVFILGGGVIETFGEIMLPEITKKAKLLTMPSLRDDLRIERTILGDDGGVIGGYYQVKAGLK
ncbi:ROK family protein [Guggenheimella bovis]